MDIQNAEVKEIATPSPKRIRRPVNAFILFANENRKKMTEMFPQESNKEISRRLGCKWRSLDLSEKNKYFQLAKVIDAEHKKKYPDYVYNPKEARMRKAVREASRERNLGSAATNPRNSTPRAPSNWIPNPEEQLMMTPSQALRGPVTSFRDASDFSSTAASPLLSGTSYGKILPQDLLSSAHPYIPSIQHNSMGHLPHEGSIWHPYQNLLPERTHPDEYMVPDLHNYQQPQQTPQNDIDDPLKTSSERFNGGEVPCAKKSPPRSSTDESKQKLVNEQPVYENPPVDCMSVNSCMRPAEPFLPVFPENDALPMQYTKCEDSKPKKVCGCPYPTSVTNSFSKLPGHHDQFRISDPLLEYILYQTINSEPNESKAKCICAEKNCLNNFCCVPYSSLLASDCNYQRTCSCQLSKKLSVFHNENVNCSVVDLSNGKDIMSSSSVK